MARQRARLRAGHGARTLARLLPLRRRPGRDRARRHAVRRRRREHREHDGVTHAPRGAGADGAVDRHARALRARRPAPRRVRGRPLHLVAVMWPEPVERIAEFLRQSEAQGRLEELPKGVDSPPGRRVRAGAFECYGNAIVAVVPDDSEIDRGSLARRAGCGELRPATARPFPFQGAQVLVDRSLLSLQTVWLEAGSSPHVLRLRPPPPPPLAPAETGAVFP